MLLAFTLAFTACKKLDLAPEDRFTELTFWQSDENVNNSLNTIYSQAYFSEPIFYNEALSDNAFTALGIDRGQPDAIASGIFTTSLARFQDEWAFYYAGIKSCNIFLKNVDINTTLSDALKSRMKAEASFFRAFHHANLVKWWGDVPLVNTDITEDEAKIISRSPRADVVKFITDELDAAAAVLPTRDQYAPADNGRVTKGAALALKARVLLYEANRMDEVVAICEQLIDNQSQNGTYALAPDYNDLFSDADVNKATNESVFSLQFVPTLRTWGEYVDFAPISAGARSNNLAPTQELVNNYIMLNGKRIDEDGSGFDENDPYTNRDPRLTATIVYHNYEWENPNGSIQTIFIDPGSAPTAAQAVNEYNPAGQGTASGYYWRKYWDPEASAPGISSGLNLHLIRWADVLLMYAEAKQALEQMTAEIWNKTIRLVRARAGFTDAGALDYPGNTNMTDIIRAERRSEFAMEGLRVDDIRRWRLSEIVLNGWAHGAKYDDPSIDNGFLRIQFRQFDAQRHYLWPIPPAEMALNANLTQNNGY